MAENDKLSINVKIADRVYPMKVSMREEETIRYAAKSINERIQQYGQRYSSKDIQDLLAMAALHYATLAGQFEQKEKENPVVEEIQRLDQELTEYLNIVL